MSPVTLNELASFIFNLANIANPYLFFGLTLMFASSALVLCRRLLVGVKQ